MREIKVLIVDDSTVFRSQIRMALQSQSQISVVGSASQGMDALEQIPHLLPDLVILDLEMPVLNGIQTILEMKKRKYSQKTIVFSSASKQGAEITLEALQAGASDFVAKPQLSENSGQPFEVIREVLVPKILALFSNLDSHFQAIATRPALPQSFWSLFQPKAVVIGSSTGGPSALEKIFSKVKGPIRCPVFIVQHMPPLFTASLAERIQKVSEIPTAEAQNSETIESNRIYIAPGGFHMRIGISLDRPGVFIDQGPMLNSVRPSVDPLFSSAADYFKEKCLGIILTGMGDDGKVGAESVKNSGGAVVIQSQESCVVYGMPKAVLESGNYDKIGNLEEIALLLKELICV